MRPYMMYFIGVISISNEDEIVLLRSITTEIIFGSSDHRLTGDEKKGPSLSHRDDQ